MRLLAIGFPLPNAEIDNYNVFTAPSYHDYDALFIDPASITKTARDLVESGTEFEAFDGRPVLNAPTSASAVSGADQARRRADETRRLLEAGGIVVVAARPDAIQGGLYGFEGLDRYHWLPAPAGLSWGAPYLRPAEGKTVRIVSEDHPMAGMLREFRKEISYRATFDDRQAEVRRSGRVIASGGAGVPIAMEFPVAGGRVIFLPAFTESSYSRSELAQALVDIIRRLDGRELASDAPFWVRSLALPGLEQVEAELDEADAAAIEAQSHASAVRERHDTLARHRRLLWEDGAPFAQSVIEALRLLGFAVTGGAGEPIELLNEGTRAFVEVESSRDQVVEWPYIRLQRRLEEHLLKDGELLKGIVIANGQRATEPDARHEQLSTPLQVASQNYRYSLLTGQDLFSLVQRVLGGADNAALTGVRRRIMSGAGPISFEVAVGEAEEPAPDAGPIF